MCNYYVFLFSELFIRDRLTNFKDKDKGVEYYFFFCFNWFAANYELLSKTKQKQNKIIPIVNTDCSDRIVIYGVIVRQKQSAFIQ